MNLMQKLKQVVPKQNQLDMREWRWKIPGYFSTRSFYKLSETPSNFIASWVFNSAAPSKIAFLVWLPSLNKCLATDNLMRRGVTIRTAYVFCAI
uniref:Reverse transcriptase zinc-binding domain-containing protein n=1 Tax=Nelumbo nucifera TaxID=4432 RepID=A0A822Y1F9_NELNU|nr:TPA_asm: hypothetical protein HUJ06_029202 [Nelumbo nucifera]